MSSPSDLATLTTCPSEFEAHSLVAVLRNEGIEAFAFGTARSALPMTSRWLEVPVQVRAEDLERARAALARNRQDSIDIDWEEIDVGERDDALPLTPTNHVPSMVRFAGAVAWGLIALTLGASFIWLALWALAAMA
jgi:hypothetical protein